MWTSSLDSVSTAILMSYQRLCQIYQCIVHLWVTALDFIGVCFLGGVGKLCHTTNSTIMKCDTKTNQKKSMTEPCCGLPGRHPYDSIFVILQSLFQKVGPSPCLVQWVQHPSVRQAKTDRMVLNIMNMRRIDLLRCICCYFERKLS